jgi:paraquat-inducible protein A
MTNAMSVQQDLVACHDCDLVQRLPSPSMTASVRCCRCGCVLQRSGGDPIATPLALALAALVLFVLSNTFPMMVFTLQGARETTYLLGGIQALFSEGRTVLAGIVLLTTFVAPLLQIGVLIYLYLPLALDRRPPGFRRAIRLARVVVPWSMLEVFLLGIIVASVKLAEQALIVPGVAAWSLGLLVVLMTVASSYVRPHVLWARVA